MWHGPGCPLFNVVNPVFLLPAPASPTLQGAMKDGFGEAVVARDTLELCKLPSLHTGKKRFLWTHKEVEGGLKTARNVASPTYQRPTHSLQLSIIKKNG